MSEGSVIFFSLTVREKLPGRQDPGLFGPGPPHYLASPSAHTHAAASLAASVPRVWPDAQMVATPFLTIQGHSTPAGRTWSPQNKRTSGNRPGASALLIGSEASSERRLGRKPGPQRSTHHPHCSWQALFRQEQALGGPQACSPPLLILACSSLVQDQAGLSPAGSWTGHLTGCNHRLETSAAGAIHAEAKKVRVGVCVPVCRGDPWGFSTISSSGVGGLFTSTAHPVLHCLGPLRVWSQGQGAAEMETTPKCGGGTSSESWARRRLEEQARRLEVDEEP